MRARFISYLLVFVSFPLAAQDYYANVYTQAERLYGEQEYAKALNLVERVPATSAYYEVALLLKGHTYLQLDSLEKSQKIFELIIEKGNAVAEAHNGLGMIYLSRIKSRSRSIFTRIGRLFIDDDFEKSEDNFLRAVELNDTLFHAQYNLSYLYYKFGDESDLNAAQNIVKSLIEKSGKSGPYLLLYSKINFSLRNYEKAERLLQQYLSGPDADADGKLWLAFVYLQRENYARFSRMFMENIEQARDIDLREKLYYDVYSLFSPSERGRLRNLDDFGRFYAVFWRQRDPNPFNEINERLVLHYKRLQVARDLYESKIEPGYDDRGEIYVRYGAPDDKYSEPIPKGSYKANESWVYKIGGTTVSYDFVETGSEYKIVDDLSSALSNVPDRRYLNALLEMYENRAHLSEQYSMALNNLKEIPLGTAQPNRIFNSLQRAAIANVQTKKALPYSSFQQTLSGQDLEYQINYAWFYKNGLPQVDLYLAIPEQHSRVKQSILLESKAGETISRDSTVISFENAPLSGGYNLYRSGFLLRDENNVKCNVLIEALGSDHKRLVNFDISVPPFEEGALNMSSVVYTSAVNERTENGELVYDITPYPFGVVDKSSILYVYFELYNLTLSEGVGRYETEIKLFRDSDYFNIVDKINIFSSKNDNFGTRNIQSATTPNTAQYLGFDLSSLTSGNYVLQVKITDKQNEEFIVRRRKLYIN